MIRTNFERKFIWLPNLRLEHINDIGHHRPALNPRDGIVGRNKSADDNKDKEYYSPTEGKFPYYNPELHTKED